MFLLTRSNIWPIKQFDRWFEFNGHHKTLNIQCNNKNSSSNYHFSRIFCQILRHILHFMAWKHKKCNIKLIMKWHTYCQCEHDDLFPSIRSNRCKVKSSETRLLPWLVRNRRTFIDFPLTHPHRTWSELVCTSVAVQCSVRMSSSHSDMGHSKPGLNKYPLIP